MKTLIIGSNYHNDFMQCNQLYPKLCIQAQYHMFVLTWITAPAKNTVQSDIHVHPGLRSP